jgi:LPXTG-motif cell wall-anchored protein
MRRRILALTAAATLGLLAIGAGPAAAAPPPLPESDTLYGIACPDYSTLDSQLPSMQLFELDTSTAEGTLIGSGTPALTETDCGGQGAWNPVTSTAYAIAHDFDTNADSVLVEIDPESGVSTVIGDFTVAGEPAYIYGIAISPTGDAYAIGDTDDYSGFFELDLASGDLTFVGLTTTNTYTLAFDPTTGILYTVDFDSELYTVDPATGVQTSVGTLGVEFIYALAIDSSGTLWFTADVSIGFGTYEAVLYSAELADLAGTAELSGTVSVGEGRPYIQALLLTYPGMAPAPEPQLAATGATATPVAVAAGLVLLLGGIAAVAIRRTRRA